MNLISCSKSYYLNLSLYVSIVWLARRIRWLGVISGEHLFLAHNALVLGVDKVQLLQISNSIGKASYVEVLCSVRLQIPDLKYSNLTNWGHFSSKPVSVCSRFRRPRRSSIRQFQNLSIGGENFHRVFEWVLPKKNKLNVWKTLWSLPGSHFCK